MKTMDYKDFQELEKEESTGAKLSRELFAEVCEWHFEDDEAGAWESACGEMWCFDDSDPIGNGMKFCPFCGRHLTQREPDEGDESEEESIGE